MAAFWSVRFQLWWLVRATFLVQTLADSADRISPPENTFCLFTTGEFIFEERLKRVAPSAKLAGVGSLSDNGAHSLRPHDDHIDLQRLFGAVYYVANDDKGKVMESAYNRMLLTDFEVDLEYDNDSTDRMLCMCMDAGLLPHAFPLPIYTEFPRDVDVKDYLDRLKKIGFPSDYATWLATLKANDKDAPTATYVRPSWFVPPPIPRTSSEFGDEPQPPFKEYPMPSGRFCMFVTNDLVFEEAMNRTAASATTIGGGMLWDTYIALGGETVPGKSPPYKGFDRVWGVAYTVDQKEFENFKMYGVKHSFFIGRERTIVKNEYQTDCLTFEIGLLPSGFPFQVFRRSEITVDLQHYLKRLSYVDVPSGYVQALQHLADLLKGHQRWTTTSYVSHSLEYAYSEV